MIVRVRLFAVAREAAGAEFVDIELSASDGAPPTVADLRQAFLAQLPALRYAAKQLMFAVDSDYATDATQVSAASDVACIPPVSGG
jgi:molybdopterin synthase sulfur carrier subunit